MKKTILALAAVAALCSVASARDIFQLTWEPGQYKSCLNFYLGQFYDSSRDSVARSYCEEAADYFGRQTYGRNDYVDTYRVRTEDGQCFKVTPDGYVAYQTTENCVDWLYSVNDYYGNYHDRGEIRSRIYDLQPSTPITGGGH